MCLANLHLFINVDFSNIIDTEFIQTLLLQVSGAIISLLIAPFLKDKVLLIREKLKNRYGGQ